MQEKYFRSEPSAHIDYDIKDTLQAAEYDPSINKKANYYEFRKKYEQKGIDLDAEFAKKPKSEHGEKIKDAFIHNDHWGFASNLAETLPLYANAPHRLGDYLQVSVTKTAKPDDQGNSFVDLVIEVKNSWVANGAPRDLQDVPEKMTFLVDVTVAEGGIAFENKMEAFRRKVLGHGKKANVLCYEDAFGNLGIERPKIFIYQNPDNLQHFGVRLGECINRLASDKFIINKPDTFNNLYRDYFFDLMNAIAENAASSSAYLKSLAPDPKRAALAREYDKIVKFVEVYKKTPLTKPRG